MDSWEPDDNDDRDFKEQMIDIRFDIDVHLDNDVHKAKRPRIQ